VATLVQLSCLNEVLEALARRAWRREGSDEDCPPDSIPTESDLAVWLGNPFARECVAKANECLSEVVGYPGGFAHRSGRLVAVVAIPHPSAVMSLPTASLTPQIRRKDEFDPPLPWGLNEVGDIDADVAREITGRELPAVSGDSGTCCVVVLEAARVHDEWRARAADWKTSEQDGGPRYVLKPDGERPNPPLEFLVAGWQKRPARVTADGHDLQILGQGLAERSPGVRVEPNLAEHSEMTTGPEESPDMIDLLLKNDSERPTLFFPANVRLGRGARMDKRLLVYCLLSMPLTDRAPGKRYELPLKLRQITDWFWVPDAEGRSSWKPSRHGKALNAAFDSANLARVRLSDGTFWLPMRVWQYPDARCPDSIVPVEIRLPPGCDHGARICRPHLEADGRIGDPAFDLCIALAYHWDAAKARNGGNRIYAERPAFYRDRSGHLLDSMGRVITSRGVPVLDWTDKRAVRQTDRAGNPLLERHPQADRVEPVTDEGLRQMAYPGDEPKRKQQRSNQRRHAASLVLQRAARATRNGVPVKLFDDEEGNPVFERDGGRYVVEIDTSGWRILECYSESP